MIVENSNPLKTGLILGLDNVIPSSMIANDMAPRKPKKKQQDLRVMSFKASPKDQAIIEAGKEKHGANLSGVIRMALRRFAEAEGIQVAS